MRKFTVSIPVPGLGKVESVVTTVRAGRQARKIEDARELLLTADMTAEEREVHQANKAAAKAQAKADAKAQAEAAKAQHKTEQALAKLVGTLSADDVQVVNSTISTLPKPQV